MFGFGQRKCKECGVALCEMEALHDRADDLMKSSAIGSAAPLQDVCAACRVKLLKPAQSLAMNLHVIEARRREAISKGSSSESAPTPIPQAVETKTTYERGGEFKTEEEKQALFGAPTFDGITNLQDLLLWLIGTKVGRNVGVGVFILLAMIINALPDKDVADEQADGTVATNAPSAIEPPVDEVAPEPPASALPIPTQSARPANNPGSWVTTVDYPQRALNEGREGITGFRLIVNAQGSVTDCFVTEPSGHEDLDATTCASISRRARFERVPAGAPDRGYRNRVTWRIPE